MKLSTLTKNQKLKKTRFYTEDGRQLKMELTIRYDDDCGNNSFAITCWIKEKHRNRWEDAGGGCCHDEIAKVFPEYAHLIKWHLVSSDGPMHYIANTLYHVSNRDCWGLLKGEEKVISYANYLRVNNSPFLYKLNKRLFAFIETTGLDPRNWVGVEPQPVEYNGTGDYSFDPKWTLSGMNNGNWYDCPFNTEKDARIFIDAMLNYSCEIVAEVDQVRIGEGKERDLDAARSSACWADATDEELLSPNLKERLEARLENLLVEFRRDIEALGFTF